MPQTYQSERCSAIIPWDTLLLSYVFYQGSNIESSVCRKLNVLPNNFISIRDKILHPESDGP
jgi:hypothetical protein